MAATEITIVDLEKKISKLTLILNDYMTIDRILAYFELKNLETQVRETLKKFEE